MPMHTKVVIEWTEFYEDVCDDDEFDHDDDSADELEEDELYAQRIWNRR
jgi:hypothetical protein